jgi:hypothetical protein
MAGKNARRKALIKAIGINGYIAEKEHRAITYMKRFGNVQQARLNKTYTVDGFRFNTGKKHRQGGNVGTSDNRTQPKMLWDIK